MRFLFTRKKLASIIAQIFANAPACQAEEHVEEIEVQGAQVVHIDIDFLNEQASGDAEVRQEFLDMFLASYGEIKASLDQAKADGDSDLWQGAMHRLKGLCANLGVQHLNQIAMNFEHDFDHAEEALLKIENEIEEIKSEIDRIAHG